MITLTSLVSSITLPNPILGNSEQLDIKTKFEQSMERKVHSTIKTTTHSKLLLTFESLTATQLAALKAFLIVSRGSSFDYTDYDSVTWSGVLLGDPFEFTQAGDNECSELWGVSLEFEAINT